jgi:hypothetical protein
MSLASREVALRLLAALFLLVQAGAQPQFPEPRVSTTILIGSWRASPIVAVGEVTNVASYGEQAVDRLPPPTMPGAHKLYWCTGDFRAVAVVKGKLSSPARKLLWASTVPGCKLLPENLKLIPNRYRTRAWFLRDDGGFLRLTFDYGAHPFLGLLSRWEDGPQLPAPQRLGVLLLTPSANTDDLAEYAGVLWDVGDIACELLGQAECARRIRGLAGLGDPKLRKAACDFLTGELGLPGCRAAAKAKYQATPRPICTGVSSSRPTQRPGTSSRMGRLRFEQPSAYHHRARRARLQHIRTTTAPRRPTRLPPPTAIGCKPIWTASAAPSIA